MPRGAEHLVVVADAGDASMNRILTADVILTLTMQQAILLETALLYTNQLADSEERPRLSDLAVAIGEQFVKQGVPL